MHRSTFLIMLKHSAKIICSNLCDVLEVVLEDSNAKTPRVLVLRFPIDSRTGQIETTCFTCFKAKELAIQHITTELFWLYHFILEYRDWRAHLDEYDDFCSNRL